jgi:hypothetical protein
MARAFTRASSHRIQCSPGALAAASGMGNRTLVVVLRRTTNAIVTAALCLNASGDFGAAIYFNASNQCGLGLDGTQFASLSTATTLTIADGWAIIAIGKASGTAAPRMHRHLYGTNAWIHNNGATSVGDGTLGATANIQLSGVFGAFDTWDGDIAAAAVFSANLTDAQVEALASSLGAWYALAPAWMVALDQASVYNLADLTGGGGNQSTVTGTAVSSSGVPLAYGASAADVTTQPAAGVVLTATGQTASAGTVAGLALALPTAIGQTTSGGTLALRLALPAATGETASGGSAALTLALPTATGQTASGGLTAGLGLGLSLTGQTTSGGTAALGIAVPLTAADETASDGTATLTTAGQAPLTAAGQTASGGTAALALAAPLSAAGQTASAGAGTVSLAAALSGAGQSTSAGTAALSLALPAATGTTVSAGTAALSVGGGATLSAAGQTISGGAATLGLAGPPDAPDAILAATENLTGPVSALWEPVEAPEETWLTATDPGQPTRLRVSFPTPGIAPGSGGPLRFRVWLRRGPTGDNPTATLDLYEAGTFRATLAAVPITSTTGQLVTADLDPGDLADPSGADVELEIRMT